MSTTLVPFTMFLAKQLIDAYQICSFWKFIGAFLLGRSSSDPLGSCCILFMASTFFSFETAGSRYEHTADREVPLLRRIMSGVWVENISCLGFIVFNS